MHLKSIITILILTLSPVLLAQTPEEKGLEIAKEAEKRDTGWGDSTVDMTMVLYNRQGDKSTREIRSRNLEVQDDGDKGVSLFDKPLDVKGTAFLSFTHVNKADDQWLYLPALKRVKRISSRNKSGPFMGSEFAYEDMTSQEVAKYNYRHLRDEPCPDNDTLTCFVIERFPVDKHSGYTRQIAWIDQSEYRAIKIDYYDRKNALLKTLFLNDYAQYLEKFWRASEAIMTNHLTGKKTVLTWQNYQFQTGLKDSDFHKNKLKRLR